ncbi:3'-5' exonuclease [Alkalilimnicola ehrlichii]|uniref:3'-5' exonuclease n=1 Tax=Alkalilimnicola ehrlichii TaxID=351052 RepID=UPI0015F24B21|nr:3'-5' exonuclease [Alkalilimnicola ehrlichii]
MKIVTIHASKGLEYPVVFCPFLWSGGKAQEELVVSYHEPERDRQTVLDFGSPRRERALELAAEEGLAEDLRLAYVALTRAKHRCYIAWGKCNGVGESGMAWLLHSPPAGEGGPLARLRAHVNARSSDELRADLAALEAVAEGAVAVDPLPEHTGQLLAAAEVGEVLVARRFTGSLRRSWEITSFSALARHSSQAELPDYDPAPSEKPPIEFADAEGVFGFPRGGEPVRVCTTFWSIARSRSPSMPS